MKITGAEWREFESNGWPKGYIWGEESILEDGRDLYQQDGHLTIQPDETFVVPIEWSVDWEGPEGKRAVGDQGYGLNVRSLIRAWRTTRNFKTIIVTVPKSEVDAAMDLFAERQWMVG